MQTLLRRAVGWPVVALGSAVVLGLREFVALQGARRAARRFACRTPAGAGKGVTVSRSAQ